jgi:hypothetical protein
LIRLIFKTDETLKNQHHIRILRQNKNLRSLRKKLFLFKSVKSLQKANDFVYKAS